MQINKFIILVLFFLSGISLSSNAQTHNLSNADIQEFKERAEQMINRLQKNLSVIGSKQKTTDVKNMYKKQTLKMFLGKGEPYRDTYGNYKRAVHMQVSSIRNGIQTKRNIEMKNYLDRLMRIRYTTVKITQAKTCRISNIYQVGDHYEATVIIFQHFVGSYNDGRGYSDDTTKKIKMYIIPERDIDGTHWTIKFGDIDVSETVRR